MWSVDGSVIRAELGGTEAQWHDVGARSRSRSLLAARCVILVVMAGGISNNREWDWTLRVLDRG